MPQERAVRRLVDVTRGVAVLEVALLLALERDAARFLPVLDEHVVVDQVAFPLPQTLAEFVDDFAVLKLCALNATCGGGKQMTFYIRPGYMISLLIFIIMQHFYCFSLFPKLSKKNENMVSVYCRKLLPIFICTSISCRDQNS